MTAGAPRVRGVPLGRSIAEEKPVRKVNTIFEWCNDVVASRLFYTELLGLEEAFFDEYRGWLNY